MSRLAQSVQRAVNELRIKQRPTRRRSVAMVDEREGDDDAIDSVSDITDGIEPEPESEPEPGSEQAPGSESETHNDEGAEPMATKKTATKRAAKKPAAKKEKKAKTAKAAKPKATKKESKVKRGNPVGKLKGVETPGRSYITFFYEEGSAQVRMRPSIRDFVAKSIENLI